MQFTDQIEKLAGASARHIGDIEVADVAVSGCLHRFNVVTREAGQALNDMITAMTPTMRARIDAMVTPRIRRFP